MPAYLDKNENFVDPELQIGHLEELKDLAKKWNLDFYSEEFARALDKNRICPSFREKFYYPKLKDLPNGLYIFAKR